VVLKLRNQPELEALLKRLYNPKDALFGHYLTPEEFQNQFRPTQADVDAVVDFLKGSGYTVTSASQAMGLVKATAPASVAEKAFGIHLDDYVSPTGLRYIAQDAPANLPVSIRPKVATVLGLFTGFEPKRFSKQAKPTLSSFLNITGHQGLAPSDVRSIYSMGNVGVTVNGAGQTVALFEEGTYTPSDINQYISYYGTGTPTITPISINGYNLGSAPGGAAAEYTLDIDMYLLLAPRIRNIEVFDNTDQGTVDFFTQLIDSYAAMAVSQKGLPLPTSISISYGISEIYLLPAYNSQGPADAAAENSALETLASQGQSVFCASGDAAAWTDQSTYPTESPNTADPGSEPYLTGAGGTSLNDSVTETYLSETSWFDPEDQGRGDFGTGGGGGVSQIWSIPSYQVGAFSTASDPQGSSSMRNVPDISTFGDYDTGGYDIYVDGSWAGYNGTSASSPLWAAFFTDVNEERTSLGFSNIGLANRALYAIAESPDYSADFHDVNDDSDNGYYYTGPGYDNSTGWGSYRGSNLFADLVEYGITPTITSLNPSNVVVGSGSAALTLQGANYFSNSVVYAGTTALSTTYVSATKLTATIPAALTATPGALPITVVNGAAGESSAASNFMVDSDQTVTGVGPSTGSTLGGTSVTVTGTGFFSGATVSFGANPATAVAVVSGTTITCIAPAGLVGTVDVTVTIDGVTSATSLSDKFTYVSPPSVSSLSPITGPTEGGTTVTITGTGFVAGSTVNFGAAAATGVIVVSGTTLVCTSPAGSVGTVHVVVSTQYGPSQISSGAQFTYYPLPSVTWVSPPAGPLAGGTAVTLTGTNFISGASVTFGQTPATNVTVVNSSSITCTSPGGTPGPVDVVVSTTQGTSNISAFDQYSYLATPAVTSVSPPLGALAGGTKVTVTGTGFCPNPVVAFGGTAATNVVVNVAGTTLTCTAPAGAVGPVDVVVSTAGGPSATSSADLFTYVASPVVQSVSPPAGPLAGGTSVTITGSGFGSVSGVSFGGTMAASFVVNGVGSITAVSPAGTAGTVDVTVTTPGGTSAATSSDNFTYDAVPSVSTISPSAGPLAGGTTVTVTGTGFVAGATVDFGSVVSPLVLVSSATSLTATSPPGSRGTVDVTVTTPGGTSGISPADQFAYQSAPTVTAISPQAGPVGGGTAITISGTGFSGGATVQFGSAPGTNVTVLSPSSITATSPPGAAGQLNVTVTTAGGTSATSAADKFTYDAFPTVTGVIPASGLVAGGSTVTVAGTGFVPGATVSFGSTPATSVVIASATSLTVTSPPGNAGVVNVIVTTPGGTSAVSSADTFTYKLPTPYITSIAPTSGPVAGGTSVLITGSGFSSGATVKFGAVTATSVVRSATSIAATAPPGTSGVVDVTVSTGGGTSATSPSDKFTYEPAPVVEGVSPAAGPLAGGSRVTVTGTGFVTGTTVKFGSTPAVAVVVVSSATVVCTAPAGNAGVVDVTVSTAGGSSGTTAADKFTYEAVPSVTRISPSAGSISGGALVTITGLKFANGAVVTFGALPAKDVTIVSGTVITCISPASAAGIVNVIVKTAGGSSPSSSADQYTYVPQPNVTSVSPSAGSVSGGGTVTISGTNLANATQVNFGTTVVTSLMSDTSTTIKLLAPSGSVGTVNITVKTVGGTSATSSADMYSYLPHPSVSSVSPNGGPVAGKTRVTITGAGFGAGATVKFGTVAASSVVVNSATSITATSPAGPAGAVDIVVSTNGGTSAISSVDRFTYMSVPTVTGVSPATGKAAGGTRVYIGGTGFVSGASVAFGAKLATDVAFISSTTLSCTSPAGNPGTVDIVVTTPGGSSRDTASDKYTYN
jgi:hypothetical protein